MKNNIKLLDNLLKESGIILLGKTYLKQDPSYARFKNWLNLGFNADMTFLNNYPDIRKNPANLEKKFNTAIICAYSYGDLKQNNLFKSPQVKSNLKKIINCKKTDYPDSDKDQLHMGYVAQYARISDYHKSLKKISKSLFEKFLVLSDQKNCSYRVLVDSAPIMEKSLACQSLAGFQGKNTLFIIPNLGSMIFLFEIFTDAFISDVNFTKNSIITPNSQSGQNITANKDKKNKKNYPAKKTKTSCGTCKRCQIHCPTNALDQDYVLDANKCIAYYTIEHRDTIPVNYWNYVRIFYFGCDICQLVCPFNRYAKTSSILKTKITKKLALTDLALMDQSFYIKHFSGTPLTRAKITGLRRNALIALYVSGYKDFAVIKKKILKENIAILVKTIAQTDDYEDYLISLKKHNYKI